MKFTDQELTAIYKRANGIGDGKNPPISTKFIFAAMRESAKEALAQAAALIRADIQQAQQAQIEEPELPEPVVAREEYAVGTGEFYTAAQMHEHYAAGVRAGMARGQSLQALQRGFEKVLADPEKHGLDLGGQK